MTLFVTGTDTGCGKTWVCAGLVHAAAANGYRAAGMKPVATGAERRADGWYNEDVAALAAAGNVPLAPGDRNPYVFAPPTSPHIAAAEAGSVIDLEVIKAAYARCCTAAEVVVVEGVGGWCVPLSETATVADLAVALGLPVALVVGVRLGCINHALLSGAAITASGVPFRGWIANLVEPGLHARPRVLATLERRIAAPLLGVVGWQDHAALAALADELGFGMRPRKTDHRGD